jgi:hypothetical protein
MPQNVVLTVSQRATLTVITTTTTRAVEAATTVVTVCIIPCLSSNNTLTLPADHDPSRYENGSQYGGGHYASRRQDGHSDVGVPGGPHGRNPYARRMNSASRSNSAYGFYPQHAYNDSYDANGQHSDGTGPWANSTDPSSENSSLDRAHGVPKQTDPYGHDIYNGPPIMEEYASDSDGGYGMPRGQRNGAPGGNPAARSQAPPVRAPIKLSGGDGAFASQGGSLPPTTRPTAAKEDKKKGFFKKRFSKG